MRQPFLPPPKMLKLLTVTLNVSYFSRPVILLRAQGSASAQRYSHCFNRPFGFAQSLSAVRKNGHGGRRRLVVIDAHCHLSRRMGGRPATLLIESMNSAGVDMAAVFGDNEFVAESARSYPDRFIPIFYFDPRYEEAALEQLEKYVKEHGWKGVKVGHQFAAARYMYRMMEKAQEYGLVVVIHSDHGARNHPCVIGELASSFPKVKTAILHMGAGVVLESELISIKVAENNPNVYLETSYIHPYAINKAVETIGAERVMFGSDESNGGYGSNFEKPGQYIDLMLDAVRLAGLPEAQQDAVLGGTAAKFYGVNRN